MSRRIVAAEHCLITLLKFVIGLLQLLVALNHRATSPLPNPQQHHLPMIQIQHQLRLPHHLLLVVMEYVTFHLKTYQVVQLIVEGLCQISDAEMEFVIQEMEKTVARALKTVMANYKEEIDIVVVAIHHALIVDAGKTGKPAPQEPGEPRIGHVVTWFVQVVLKMLQHAKVIAPQQDAVGTEFVTLTRIVKAVPKIAEEDREITVHTNIAVEARPLVPTLAAGRAAFNVVVMRRAQFNPQLVLLSPMLGWNHLWRRSCPQMNLVRSLRWRFGCFHLCQQLKTARCGS